MTAPQHSAPVSILPFDSRVVPSLESYLGGITRCIVFYEGLLSLTIEPLNSPLMVLCADQHSIPFSWLSNTLQEGCTTV